MERVEKAREDGFELGGLVERTKGTVFVQIRPRRTASRESSSGGGLIDPSSKLPRMERGMKKKREKEGGLSAN